MILKKRIQTVNKLSQYVKDMKPINASGPFYFDENTLNKPADIPKGYLRATFTDFKNGVVEVITTNKYYEIIDGKMSELKERA